MRKAERRSSRLPLKRCCREATLFWAWRLACCAGLALCGMRVAGGAACAGLCWPGRSVKRGVEAGRPQAAAARRAGAVRCSIVEHARSSENGGMCCVDGLPLRAAGSLASSARQPRRRPCSVGMQQAGRKRVWLRAGGQVASLARWGRGGRGASGGCCKKHRAAARSSEAPRKQPKPLRPPHAQPYSASQPDSSHEPFCACLGSHKIQ